MSTSNPLESVKCSLPTLNALADIIIGKSSNSPYKTLGQIMQFFDYFKGNYSSVPRTRMSYAQGCLAILNGSTCFSEVIEAVVDPREFFNSDYKVEDVVNTLNQYLEHDGYELKLIQKKYQLRPLNVPKIKTVLSHRVINQQYIEEQIEKCEQKIASKDFDGAITNARSLIEAVLLGILERVTNEKPSNDGDLIKLYIRVRKTINLDPEQEGITGSLQDILRGLITIVHGIAALRNKMSDAHARTYKPAKHHADLAVNTAKTLTVFLFDTVLYQEQKNRNITIQADKKAV